MKQHRTRWLGRGWTGVTVLALALASTAAAVTPNHAEPATAAAVSGSPPAGESKPNIVYVLTDDLDQRTTPYWDVLPKTKKLLADRGMTFENSFAPTPICCPARSTILTGQLGHNTGVLTNQGSQGGWEAFVSNGGEQRTVAKALAEQAGYHTALIGKYLNGYGVNNRLGYPATYVPPGWSEWYGAVDGHFYNGYDYRLNENGSLVSYGHTAADYSTDVVRDKAIDVIDHAEIRDDDQPMFLYLASTAPHAPLPPPQRYANNPYSDSTARHLPNFQERDLSDKPAWLRASGKTRSAQIEANNDTDWQNRMGSLYAVDDMVAAVAAELKAKGELDNTYFVFTSDNGYNLGAHRLGQKMVPYEESLRVPLIVAGPGVEQGKTSAFAMQTDFAPTFYQMAGLPIPSYVDGRSLMPLLAGSTPADWRTDFEVQYVNNVASMGPEAEIPPGAPPELSAFLGLDVASYRALRTKRYLYVEWYDEESAPQVHEYELYDLRADPWQLDNILATKAGRAESEELVDRLRTRLATVADCAGATCRS
jgi:N-acetylglucosamine-6-sulfatase